MSTQERIISLLGTGVAPEQVASALGVTPSYVSQMLSDPAITAQVAELRYEHLQKHNARDNEYDELEDQLVARLKDLMPLMVRPMEVLKSIQVINAAKRRGQSAPQALVASQNIVQITVPTQIINRFTTNVQNQVIKAGEQELLTMQSGTLLREIKESQTAQLKELQNAAQTKQLTTSEQAPTAKQVKSG